MNKLKFHWHPHEEAKYMINSYLTKSRSFIDVIETKWYQTSLNQTNKIQFLSLNVEVLKFSPIKIGHLYPLYALGSRQATKKNKKHVIRQRCERPLYWKPENMLLVIKTISSAMENPRRYAKKLLAPKVIWKNISRSFSFSNNHTS